METAPPPASAAQTAAAVVATTAKPAGLPPVHALPAKTGAAPAKKDCDPPYFVDSAGHRQYKKECF